MAQNCQGIGVFGPDLPNGGAKSLSTFAPYYCGPL